MKKKMQRVPDFSSKKGPSKLPSKPGEAPAPHAPATPVQTIKPHSTSQKSGRRGS